MPLCMHTFNQFLQKSDHNSVTDVVGLAIYYLHTYGEEDVIDVSMIRTLFNVNNISISETAIVAHFSQLDEENLIEYRSRKGGLSGYVLATNGFAEFGQLAGEWGSEGVREDRFIDIDRIDNPDYAHLVRNINKCYRYGINDATLVLTRKLFENFIIDILRAEYGGSQVELYFNTNRGRFHGLGTLCGNLSDKILDLGHYSRLLDDDLINRIRVFKEEGNSQAHSVRIDIDDEELDEMREEATDLAGILWDIREEIRVSNK